MNINIFYAISGKATSTNTAMILESDSMKSMHT